MVPREPSYAKERGRCKVYKIKYADMKSRRICKIGSSFPYQDDIDQEETIPVQ